MNSTVYLRLRNRVEVKPDQAIKIKDIAKVVTDQEIKDEIENLILHVVTKEDKTIIVIDVIHIVQEIRQLLESVEIETFGSNQTIVEVVYPKKNLSPIKFVFVWLLLFVGAALAIMNFHEDVSMQEVHIRLYRILTGEENEKPLILQIPYSIGLGLGMVLFFNHVFRKRINEEPSPLEVEVFNYQMNIDKYVSMNENKESMKKVDGH
ncbi:stage V sporulation protein AA [Bacillus sp. FJAT-47783]|uniref:stage V sporulation protein AA n=1 Tax=Bacillus sp. FJAT-47783 TaxID=2922712 RepID=UPI001FAD6EB1|nr:stage V sporulation protein AA [Bacillus sp. FJAT-47783]